MPSEEPLDDRCGAKCRSGGFCTQYPVTGSERCRMHGGTNPGPGDGNGNAESHGLTADSDKWFERHRDDVGDRVRKKVVRAIEHVPFSWENLIKMDELVQAAINQEQIRQGDQYLRDKGIITKENIVAGEKVLRQDAENPASLQKSRAQKDTIRILKELGYLDDPDSAQADAAQSLVDILSE